MGQFVRYITEAKNTKSQQKKIADLLRGNKDFQVDPDNTIFAGKDKRSINVAKRLVGVLMKKYPKVNMRQRNKDEILSPVDVTVPELKIVIVVSSGGPFEFSPL